MRDLGRVARRLATASVIALVLTAAAAAVPAVGPGAVAGVVPGPGPGAVDNPAPGLPGAVALPAGAPPPEGRGDPRLLGVVGGRPAQLVRLDPRTLEPLPGGRIVLPSGISGYAWSPDRRLLALGDFDDDVVHVVDPERMRRIRRVRFGIVARAPRQVVWLGPRRLAVVAGDPRYGTYLLMVDPQAGRVLSRRRLGPAVLTGMVAGDRLALLRTSADGIRPAGLLVMDARGGIRAVELTQVQAGLRVTYRHLRQPQSLLRRLAHWLVPAAGAKLAAGSWRAACWLGGGTLAVWGTDARVTGDAPAELRSDTRPSGVKLVDARTWTVRPLDPGATGARWQAGRLLAFGSTWDAEAQRERGTGLTVYGPDDDRRHLLGDLPVVDASLHGELVYAGVDRGGEQPGRAVLSLRSGRALRASDDPLPYLLLDERDSPC